MGFPMPTHFDIVVMTSILFSIGMLVVVAMFWLVWQSHREWKQEFKEMQRMTRAVAGLVVQESEKIRELMR